ncbi:MAG: hypothetical protein KC445_17925 [Anaerolineales bacterium]|nr:hypothetical protein [Anaerolineales bacterium]
MLNRLIELETAVSPTTFAPEGERPFTHQPGPLPILISAPHATAHQRHKRLKKEEGFTGALAQLLAETTGAHTLYTRYRSPDDPNWDRQNRYKTRLGELAETYNIRFVVDLHGMSDRHNIGVALGSMNGRSCPNHESLILQTVRQHLIETHEEAAESFRELHWDHFVHNHSRFTGGVVSHTVTRFASQQLGVPALQIELCSSVRVVRKRPSAPLSPGYEPILHTVAMLQNLVCTLAENL